MTRPIEHFENIDDPDKRADELHREIESLEKVLKHLRRGTDALDDVANPGGVGKALEDGLEDVREAASEAFTVADRGAESLEQRIDKLERLRTEARDEIT